MLLITKEFVYLLLLVSILILCYTIWYIYHFVNRRRKKKNVDPSNSIVIEDKQNYTEISQSDQNKNKIKEDLLSSLEEILILIKSRKFTLAISELELLKKIAQENSFYGILSEIERKIQICQRNLQFQARQDEIWFHFEKGNIAESYIEIIELQEEIQTTASKEGIDEEIVFSIDLKVKKLKEEFQKDRENVKTLITHFNSLLFEEKFYTAQKRLSFTKEICQNLKFNEYIPPITALIKQCTINIQFWEDLEKNKILYEKGKTRLAYNGMDVLERKVKLAQFKEIVIDSVGLKIFIFFRELQKELRSHKKELDSQVWKVFQLTNDQKFDEARLILNQSEKEARIYDFFSIIRDIDDQRKEILKIELMLRKEKEKFSNQLFKP